MRHPFREWRQHHHIYKKVTLLERGVLACSKCGKHADLNDLAPLQLVECQKCGMYNFVPQRIDRFWLLEPLGSGAMGRVYKAASAEEPKEFFAVKLLPMEQRDNPELIETLMHEAELAERCGDHPSLVKCVAKGYYGDEPFYAMEYVEGERLENRIERRESLPIKEVCDMALDLLSAEQRIYDEGFLYRDLKPENVLFNRDDRAMLFDYGLCMSLEQAQNPEEDFMHGSVYYIPPERWFAQAEDAYSEIYSLGLVMYYAVTGRNLIQSKDLPRVAKRHTSSLRVPLKSKLKGFPPDVVEVLSNMVQQESSQRYQTFEEASEAIRQLRDAR